MAESLEKRCVPLRPQLSFAGIPLRHKFDRLGKSATGESQDMSVSLSPKHFKLYKDVLVLLAKYGHGDLVKDAPVVDDPLDFGPRPTSPPEAKELAADLERLGP